MIKKNSIVQVNEAGGEWAGCLLQVSEVKNWGVQAYLKIPNSGTAYIRLNFDQVEHVGEAVLEPKEQD